MWKVEAKEIKGGGGGTKAYINTHSMNMVKHFLFPIKSSIFTWSSPRSNGCSIWLQRIQCNKCCLHKYKQNIKQRKKKKENTSKLRSGGEYNSPKRAHILLKVFLRVRLLPSHNQNKNETKMKRTFPSNLYEREKKKRKRRICKRALKRIHHHHPHLTPLRGGCRERTA